jgi:hypothetical protein
METIEVIHDEHNVIYTLLLVKKKLLSERWFRTRGGLAIVKQALLIPISLAKFPNNLHPIARRAAYTQDETSIGFAARECCRRAPQYLGTI